MRSKVGQVAWREFKHTVLTKAFLFAVIGVPFLIVAVMGIAVLMMKDHEEPPLVGVVAVSDPTGELVPALRLELSEDPPALLPDMTPDEAAEAAAEAMRSAGGGSEMLMGAFGRGVVDLTVETLDVDADGFDAAVRPRIQDGDLVAAAIVPEALLAPLLEDGEETAPIEGYRVMVADRSDSDHISLIERGLGRAVASSSAFSMSLHVPSVSDNPFKSTKDRKLGRSRHAASAWDFCPFETKPRTSPARSSGISSRRRIVIK